MPKLERKSVGDQKMPKMRFNGCGENQKPGTPLQRLRIYLLFCYTQLRLQFKLGKV
jgi:hypothetical protein